MGDGWTGQWGRGRLMYETTTTANLVLWQRQQSKSCEDLCEEIQIIKFTFVKNEILTDESWTIDKSLQGE